MTCSESFGIIYYICEEVIMWKCLKSTGGDLEMITILNFNNKSRKETNFTTNKAWHFAEVGKWTLCINEYQREAFWFKLLVILLYELPGKLFPQWLMVAFWLATPVTLETWVNTASSQAPELLTQDEMWTASDFKQKFITWFSSGSLGVCLHLDTSPSLCFKHQYFLQCISGKYCLHQKQAASWRH